MAWVTIMEGNSLEEFSEATPIVEDLPAGTRFRIVIDTHLPVAPIANILGAEWLAQQLLDYEARVIDVYSVGWYQVVIEMEALGVPPLVIAAIIIAAIFAVGYLISAIRMDAQLPGPIANLATIVKWAAIGAIGVLGIKLASDYMRERKEVKA